jgi:hypothetical protein
MIYHSEGGIQKSANVTCSNSLFAITHAKSGGLAHNIMEWNGSRHFSFSLSQTPPVLCCHFGNCCLWAGIWSMAHLPTVIRLCVMDWPGIPFRRICVEDVASRPLSMSLQILPNPSLSSTSMRKVHDTESKVFIISNFNMILSCFWACRNCAVCCTIMKLY